MPNPVTFNHTGTVGAPLDRVFALLSDPKRMPDWLPGCKSIVPKEQLMRKGARYHVAMGTKGVRVEIEIIDYNPPRAIGWIEHLRRAGNKTFFKLESQGGATGITIKHVWHPPSWRAWFLGQFYRRRDALRIFNGTIENLRKALLK